MRLVTFSTALAPHGAGDTRLVTDEVAAELHKKGLISASERFPAAQKPKRPASAAVFDQRFAR